MTDVERIRARIQAAATQEGRTAAQKFVPTAIRVSGVRVPVLNELASEFKGVEFETVDALWSSGMYEERLLAAKLLGRLAKKHPLTVWNTILRLAPGISDWPTCDTLATESVRPALKLLAAEVAAAASDFVQDDREWIRRFGLVLLTNLVRNPEEHDRIQVALETISGDRRAYVRKAADWLRRDLQKARSERSPN